MAAFLISLSGSETNHEYAITAVGIHNGLVTVIWSIALLIALAAAVRFLLESTSVCVY